MPSFRRSFSLGDIQPMKRRAFLQTTGLAAAAAAVDRIPRIAKAEALSVKAIPDRSEVPLSDTWDLSSLFPNDKAWETAFEAWRNSIDGYAAVSRQAGRQRRDTGRVHPLRPRHRSGGRSAGHLRHAQDGRRPVNSVYQRMHGPVHPGRQPGRASYPATSGPRFWPFPTAKIDEFLKAPGLAPYKLLLSRILRFKPHTLGEKEERLLAMQTEMAGAASQHLPPAERRRHEVRRRQGRKGPGVELTHGTFISLLYSPDREGPRDGVSSVLPAVHGTRAHAGRVARRVGRSRRLLRQSAELPLVARRLAVSRS